LRRYIHRAQRAVLMVDPYLDEVIIDDYLVGLGDGVALRLLTSEKNPNTLARLLAALRTASTPHRLTVEVRVEDAIHDRLVFVDALDECLAMGSSIRTAGKSSPTYLTMLDFDIAALKRRVYERLWDRATAKAY
jgi:hypothetical protein